MTSGETAQATTDNDPITLATGDPGRVYRQLAIINESGVKGFFRINGDGWKVWLTDAKSLLLDTEQTIDTLEFKRVEDGTNVTGLYAWAV